MCTRKNTNFLGWTRGTAQGECWSRFEGASCGCDGLDGIDADWGRGKARWYQWNLFEIDEEVKNTSRLSGEDCDGGHARRTKKSGDILFAISGDFLKAAESRSGRGDRGQGGAKASGMNLRTRGFSLSTPFCTVCR